MSKDLLYTDEEIGSLLTPRLREFRLDLVVRYATNRLLCGCFTEREEKWIEQLAKVAKEAEAALKIISLQFCERGCPPESGGVLMRKFEKLRTRILSYGINLKGSDSIHFSSQQTDGYDWTEYLY